MENSIKKSESYFTKKRIIIFSIITIIFIAFIILTSKFFFDINFKKIYDLLAQSYKSGSMFWLWLFLLMLFPIYNWWFRIVLYKYKLKKCHIYVQWYDWICFCFISFFIANITPFQFGAEPYIIYWLKKKGISLKEATAMVASLSVVSPFVQVLITWPSFFVLCSDYGINSVDPGWVGCFWSVFTGLMFDLMGTTFTLLMSISKKAHYYWNVLINKVKKIFKLKYKTNQEIENEYVKNASFKKLFLKEVKDIKFLIFTILGSITWNVLYYCTMIFAFHLTAPNAWINAAELFNYTNVSTTANNFIPIPGAEGTLQAVLNIFIINSKTTTISVPAEQLSSLTTNTVFIWRTFTFYIVAIFGIFALFVIVFKESRKTLAIKRKTRKGIAQHSYTFVIRNIKKTSDLFMTINSINHANYDQDKVEIIVINDCNLKDSIKKKLDKLGVKVCTTKNNNLSKQLKQCFDKDLIKNWYVNIINSGEEITYHLLWDSNTTMKSYDLYSYAYRLISNRKKKLEPFYCIHHKYFKTLSQKSSPFINISAMMVDKDILLNSINNTSKISNDVELYGALIKNSETLKYSEKLWGYPNRDIDLNYSLKSFKWLMENDLEQLAINLAVSNKTLRNEIINSKHIYRIANKPNFSSIKPAKRLIYKRLFNKQLKSIFIY